MPRVQADYAPGAEALRTTAAPNIQTVQARFDPNESKAFQLASVFAKAEPTLDKIKEEQASEQRRKEIMDTMRIPALVERVQQEHGSGVVTAVQAGVVPPNQSTIVTARTDEALGTEWGKKNIQPLITSVMNNAALIQDPVKRADYIKEERSKLVGQLPKDNDFFLSGAVGAMDKELNQYENTWQRQSSAYVTEVQSKDFSGKVSEAIKSADPDKALLDLDASFKQTSALDDASRNKLVVDTFTQEAYADRNPDLMNKIPARFLNAETKAKIQKTRAAIQEVRTSEYSFTRRVDADKREDQIRTGKVDILKRFAAGQAIDPAEFKDNPDLNAFTISVMNNPRKPAAESSANAQRIRTSILNQSTVQGLDQNKVIDSLMNNKDLNPNDREKLINEIPKLIEGTIAMNDDMVKSAYSTRIGASLEEAAKNPLSKIRPTLRSQTVNLFDQKIRQGFTAYYEEHQGSWPTGRNKQDIVDRAVETTEKFMHDQLKFNSDPAPAAAAPKPAAPKPAAPAARPTPTQADIDYVKKNPQFRQKFINTFGREP